MSYNVFYYADLAMTAQMPDMDNVFDLGSPPDGRSCEVAHAINANDDSLIKYGYQGAWHERPPQETLDEERRQEALGNLAQLYFAVHNSIRASTAALKQGGLTIAERTDHQVTRSQCYKALEQLEHQSKALEVKS